MSLAVKSSLVTSITISVLMLVFGFVTYSTSRSALNREIDVHGVNLARSLALLEVDWWSSRHGTLREAARRVRSDFKSYGAFLTHDYGIRVEPVDRSAERKPTPGADEQRAAAARADQAIEARNGGRIARLLRHGKDGPSSVIADAFINEVGGDKRTIAKAIQKASTFRATSGTRGFVTADGTLDRDAQIVEGRFLDGGGARSYSYPIVDAGGRITHRAYVFLSEREIQKRLGQLLVKILLCTLTFIATGAAVSFALTRHMTAPLTSLVHDIEVVAKGNFNHRTIARSTDEIGLLARTFDKMVRSLADARTERTEHRALQHEVAVASEVQSKLIPDSIPIVPGYELDVLHHATGDVSGTYYDVLELPDGRLGLLVAEGSGEGVPAAMTVVMARSLLRSECERGHDPKALLQRVNAALSRDIRKGMYVSALFAVLEPESRKMEICGAGSVSLLLFRASDQQTETIVPDGIALGFDKGPVFDRSLRVTELELEIGDRIVLATGAPIRLENPKGDALGAESWQALVTRVAPKNTSAFMNLLGGALERYRGDAPLREDLIVMTLRAGEPKSIG